MEPVSGSMAITLRASWQSASSSLFRLYDLNSTYACEHQPLVCS